MKSLIASTCVLYCFSNKGLSFSLTTHSKRRNSTILIVWQLYDSKLLFILHNILLQRLNKPFGVFWS